MDYLEDLVKFQIAIRAQSHTEALSHTRQLESGYQGNGVFCYAHFYNKVTHKCKFKIVTNYIYWKPSRYQSHLWRTVEH